MTVAGAGALDWEDIAVGPGPDGTPWIWVADTGDNLTLPPERYHLPASPSPTLGAAPPARLDRRGPRAHHVSPTRTARTTSRALMVDPVTGDALPRRQGRRPDQTVPVYRLPATELARRCAASTPQWSGG